MRMILFKLDINLTTLFNDRYFRYIVISGFWYENSG